MRTLNSTIKNSFTMAATLFVCGSTLSFAGADLSEKCALEKEKIGSEVRASTQAESPPWRHFLLNKEFREPHAANN